MQWGKDFVALFEMVDYRDASEQRWNLHYFHEPVPFVQVRFLDPGTKEPQHGRKWLLSAHMTDSEVISTALKAVLTAEEHEARERFRFKGVRVFSPHLNVHLLADLAGRRTSLDLREEV